MIGTQFLHILYIFFKELKMKKLTLLAIVSLMALSACNTISGAGRDVSAPGGAVSSGAENVQQKMSHYSSVMRL